MFLVLAVHWATLICGFIVSIKFEKCVATNVQYFVAPPHLSLSETPGPQPLMLSYFLIMGHSFLLISIVGDYCWI